MGRSAADRHESAVARGRGLVAVVFCRRVGAFTQRIAREEYLLSASADGDVPVT